jgi:hypothetical protein
MKIKAILSLALILSLLFTGCENWIDPEINIDPDNPSNAGPAVILPACQSELAFYLGGFEGTGAQSIWMQQILGQDRQAGAYNEYNYKESDANNLWDGFFAGFMMDLRTIIDISEAAPARNFAGIGKVLMAVALGNATDMFGDVPYTEAFKGADNLTPTFDSQQSIYNEIDDLLTEAIADLASTDPGENTISVGADYFYGGDLDAWMAAAYTLRARYQMHLAKRGSVNYDDVISDLDNGIASISGDMEQPFGEGSAEWNPLYNYTQQRSGYISENGVFESFFLDDTVDYGVADPRAGLHEWGSGPWTSPDSPIALVQATEGLFLKAEAQWRNNAFADARTTLKSAVAMAMEKVEIDMTDADATTWMTEFEADVDATADADLLEVIMVQKYLHMYCQPEAFTDWRRTGFPDLSPTAGTQIPRRLPYATDERQYNPNVPDYGTIFSRLWWDVQ